MRLFQSTQREQLRRDQQMEMEQARLPSRAVAILVNKYRPRRCRPAPLTVPRIRPAGAIPGRAWAGALFGVGAARGSLVPGRDGRAGRGLEPDSL